MWAALGKAALGSLMSMGLEDRREKRVFDNQKRLMGQQLHNQRVLNNQGYELSKKLWDETNYGAQMEHLKNAGLNPALMYKMGGSGGQTSGMGGGSAAGGNVSSQMSGMQGAMLMSQIDLQKAQTEKLLAEAEKISGVDTSHVRQSKALMNAQTVKLIEEHQLLNRQNEIEHKFKNSLEKKLKYEALNLEIETRLKQSKANLTDEQITQVKHKILQDWVNSGSLAIGSLGTIIVNAIKNLKK